MRKWRIYERIIINLVIFQAIILIGYEFEGFRGSVKNVIIAILDINVAEKINYIYVNFLSEIFRGILYIGIILMLINYGISIYLNNRIRNFNFEDNLFNKALYNYLKSNDKRCFIITGEWGTGKTHKVRNFIDKYLPYIGQKAYYISCFGISSRNELISQLRELYEKEDNSFRLQIAEGVKIIPLIGEFLYRGIKPRYEFKDMGKKSIFVFDDFERVTPILNDYADRNIYSYSDYGFGRDNSFNTYSEFKHIKNEFEKIEKELMYNREIEEKLIRKDILSKYNVITGLINELVDIYEMKVILLCNSDVIDNRYYRDIFDRKLECIRFKVNYLDIDINSLAIDNINRYVSLDYRKREFLLQFFNQYSYEIKDVWYRTGIENNRVLSGVIVAFINFIDEVDLELIIKNKKSIFYSIFIAHIAYNYNSTRILSSIRIGERLLCYDQKYSMTFSKETREKNKNFKYLDSVENKDDIVWCGEYIALSWMVGTHLSRKIVLDELSKLENYNSSIEKYLIKKNLTMEDLLKAISKVERVNIDDLLICISFIDDSCESYIENLKEIFSSDKINFNEVAHTDIYGSTSIESMIFNLMDRARFIEIFEKSNELKELIFSKLYISFGSNIDENKVTLSRNDILEKYIEWKNEGLKAEVLY